MDAIDTSGLQGPDFWNWRQDPEPRPEYDAVTNTPAFTGREQDMEIPDPAMTEQAQGQWQRLIGLYIRELDTQAQWRAEMAEDEAFYDGDQISDDDRAAMELRGQLPITYNVIAPSVNWMLGQERRGRSQPKILARHDNGSRHAEHKTKLMKYVYDQSQGEMAVSHAYRDAVRSGMGWLESGRQPDDEGEPVFMSKESWRNILHDSRAEKLDFSDARFMFRTRWSDLDVAGALFRKPWQQGLIEQSAVESTDYFLGHDDLGDDFMDERERFEQQVAWSSTTGDSRRRRVRLIEGWYRMPVETEVLLGGEFHGSIYMPGHPGHEQSLMTNAGIATRIKMRMHVAILTARGMLHMQPSPYVHNTFPFTPIIGNLKAGTGEPYGIIRNLKDIQTDVNRRAAKALHIVSTNKVIMDEGAVEDVDKLAEEVARPDAMIVKKRGYQLDLNADRELAPAHMELFSRGVLMIQSISGITDENMGRETNATSGKAIYARQDQGTTTTWHYTDNLRYALRAHGEKMLALIEQYYTQEKQFRITNERGSPDWVKVNDGLPENAIAMTRADFVVSEDEWKATIRQAQVDSLLEVLQQLAPVAPQLVFALLDLLVEAMDIPSKEAIVTRIRSVTGQEDPDADPNNADPETIARREAKAAEAEMQRRAAAAEIAGREAEASEKEARAFKASIDGLKTAHSLTTDQLQTIKTALETAVEVMNAKPAAGVADQLMADAENITATAMRIAQMKTMSEDEKQQMMQEQQMQQQPPGPPQPGQPGAPPQIEQQPQPMPPGV
jgi:hypothetical protein